MTERQVSDDELMGFVRTYSADHGFAPSMREIGAGTGLASTSSVWYRLVVLRNEGRVTWNDNQPRTLKVVE